MQISRATAGRFAALLRQPDGRRAEYDQPLLESTDWVVAPTLGAIVPNWLIALPRDPALNLRAWKKQFGRAPQGILDDLCEHLGVTFSDLVWFEHGPVSPNSPIGCGTDYAHLHIIFQPSFTFEDFAQQSITLSQLWWKRATFSSAYESLPDTGSYLVAGSGDQCILTSQVESTGSQFFRQVVGLLSDRVSAWNYKRFPHADNIAKTITNFRTLESAPGCGG